MRNQRWLRLLAYVTGSVNQELPEERIFGGEPDFESEIAFEIAPLAAFHAESKRTGEYVRIRLRTLLRSGTIAALLLILCPPSLPGKPRFGYQIRGTHLRQAEVFSRRIIAEHVGACSPLSGLRPT